MRNSDYLLGTINFRIVFGLKAVQLALKTTQCSLVLQLVYTSQVALVEIGTQGYLCYTILGEKL